MSGYSPELGQMAFGQPWQPQQPSRALERAIEAIANAWGIAHPNGYSPFSNTGERYDGKVFSAHAYSWNDEEEQEFNFKYRDLRVSWYKYVGRGMSCNANPGPKFLLEMVAACIDEIAEGQAAP